jgi:hypothetical protein
LRRVFGPKRDEVTGDWRKLHSEELRDLCYVIFGCSYGAGRNVGEQKCSQTFVAETCPLSISEDNIKISLAEVML